jgi:hypothetical protein
VVQKAHTQHLWPTRTWVCVACVVWSVVWSRGSREQRRPGRKERT